MPNVNRDNAWAVYLDLLEFFRAIEVEDDPELADAMSSGAARPAVGDDADGEEKMDVLPLRHPRGRQRIQGGTVETVDGRQHHIGGSLIFDEDPEDDQPLIDVEWTDSDEDDSDSDHDST